MDANNTTALAGSDNGSALAGANSTGATGAATIDLNDLLAFLLFTLGIFAASWIVLTAAVYVVAPYWARFADRRSRFAYSAVLTLPFAIISAVGFGGTMSLIAGAAWSSNATVNMIFPVVIALALVFALVYLQSYLLNRLTARGTIRMEPKSKPPKTVKGKGPKGRNEKSKNVKGRRK